MIVVDVQLASAAPRLPGADQITGWVCAALVDEREAGELTVRIVDEAEGAELNARYRGRDGATNVLSFPFEAPPAPSLGLLGDVVICAPVIEREAREQRKGAEAHWAHVVVHGVLHLAGHDHQDPSEAERMEALERRVLARLGYADPYAVDDDDDQRMDHGQGQARRLDRDHEHVGGRGVPPRTRAVDR